jgi:hypothetical protein
MRPRRASPNGTSERSSTRPPLDTDHATLNDPLGGLSVAPKNDDARLIEPEPA